MLDGQLLNFNRDIQVRAGRTLDLAEMAFCRDSQQSSVNSAEHPAGKLNSGPDLAPPQGSVNTASPQSDCQAGSTLAQCQDNDKDGVIAQQDCDDADPNTRPGALEKCDGRDNNCNGIVDDVNEFYMTHAIGRCENGKKTIKQCDRGFADCDGDPTNGCEININKDAENCGACGNSCSDLETCQLGIC
jgi:hypothetical protein